MTLAGSSLQYFQGTSGTPATANGNGQAISTDGFGSAQQIEVVESNGGTVTLTLEGSFDGTNWYAAGYQQVDATASVARAASGISVAANSKHVYQVLDPYPLLRARISSLAASANVIVRGYLVGD